MHSTWPALLLVSWCNTRAIGAWRWPTPQSWVWGSSLSLGFCGGCRKLRVVLLCGRLPLLPLQLMLLLQHTHTHTQNCKEMGQLLTRLDSCNSLLCDLPDVLMDKLHCLQNTAACMVTRTKKYDHTTRALCQLHSLWTFLVQLGRILYLVCLCASE